MVVDGAYEKDSTGKDLYRDRTQKELSKIESLVKGAVGYDLARGDALEVQTMQFNNEYARSMEFDQKVSIEEEKWRSITNYIVYFLIIVVAAVVIHRMGKAMAEAMNPPLPEVELPKSLEDQEDIAEIPENVARSNELLEKVEIMAENDPNNVAKIIRDWLNESIKKA